MKQQFVGFGKFSDFMEELNPLLPVNCMLTLETNPGKQGAAHCYSVLMVSQAKAEEVIYFRFVAAHYMTIAGTPLGNTHVDRSILAKNLTLELLTPYHVRNTSLSMPKTLKYLEGDQDMLRYKKEDDTFYIYSGAGDAPQE